MLSNQIETWAFPLIFIVGPFVLYQILFSRLAAPREDALMLLVKLIRLVLREL